MSKVKNAIRSRFSEEDDEDRDEFDGRDSKVIGVYSNIKKQREMEEDYGDDYGDWEELDLGEDDSEVEEGNAFTGALANAKKSGEDSFEVDGKEYNVNESEDKWIQKTNMKKGGIT
jgi:hypothetical protein